VPSGTKSYRIKYSRKNVVEWLSFDPVKNQFTVDRDKNEAWFAASEIGKPPAPGPDGSLQKYEVDGFDPDVQWHFAIRAYVRRKQ
jgi:hypothetical protein